MNNSKILLIFQEKGANVNFIDLILRKEGFQVEQHLYTNMTEIITAVLAFQPHAILWQFQMYWQADSVLKEFQAEMNYMEKERPANLLIIDIIGQVDPGFQYSGWVDELLLQPFTVQELRSSIAKLLQ